MKRVREDGAQSLPPKKAVSASRVPGLPATLNLVGHKLTTNDALTYLRDVKNRFADKKDVYDTFLEIMKDFKAQKIDTAGVILRVKQLFKGHRELILGFNTFLPRGYEIQLQNAADEAEAEVDEQEEKQTSKQPVEFDQAINYVNKIKTRFSNDERVYKSFLEILNLYRRGNKSIRSVYEEVAVLFQNHNDLLTEFTFFLPDHTQIHSAGAGLVRKDNQQAQRAHVQPAPVSGPTPGSVSRPPATLRQSQKPRQPQNIREYYPLSKEKEEKTQIKTQQSSEDEAEVLRCRQLYARDLQFFDRCRLRLRSREAHQELLKVLNMFTHDIISRGELVNLVSDILAKWPDLMSTFQDLVAVPNATPESEGIPEGRRDTSRRELGVRDGVRPKIGGPPPKEKPPSSPLHEALVPSGKRITPSYIKMQPGQPVLRCSGRTPLGNSVLNDTLVNVTSGSEDYSFKLMRKNQYEEALFRCEDDRFELEMCIETNAWAIRCLRPLAATINRLSTEDRPSLRRDIENFPVIVQRAIERLYADQGGVLMELLLKNPTVAVPVVLARLEQKDAEWQKVLAEMTETWRKIYEANYHKSLDHRSFYFKQADKKTLAPRSLMSELKERAEERRGADADVVRAVAPAPAMVSPAVADLEYDYSDRQVHDDVYAVVVAAVAEGLHPESRAAVMRMWVEELEPFLGLPRRGVEVAVGQVSGGHRLRTRRSGVPPRGGSADDEGVDPDADVKSESSDESTSPQPETTPAPKEEDEAGEERGSLEVDTEMQDADGKTNGKVAEGKVPGGTPPPEPVTASGISAVTATATAAAVTTAAAAVVTVKTEDDTTASLSSSARPVAPLAVPSSWHRPPSQHVLMANDSLYLLFRYHQLLYERLQVARRCAVARNQPVFRQTGEPSRPLDAASEAAARAEAEEVHSCFMTLLRGLLAGSRDITSYEDAVRSQLGTNSYVLFTLDKLALKLVKHAASVALDETTNKLWELHRYEAQRTTGVHDSVYALNSSTIPGLEEPTLRICFDTEKCVLTMTQLEEKGPGAELLETGVIETAYGQYVLGYVNLPHDFGIPLETKESKPLICQHLTGFVLPRNLASSPHYWQAREDSWVSQATALHIANGLEMNFQPQTSKVSYVLDTEDVMWRGKGRARLSANAMEALRERRKERFDSWKDEWGKSRAEELKGARPQAQEEGGEEEAGPSSRSAPTASCHVSTPGPQSSPPATATMDVDTEDRGRLKSGQTKRAAGESGVGGEGEEATGTNEEEDAGERRQIEAMQIDGERGSQENMVVLGGINPPVEAGESVGGAAGPVHVEEVREGLQPVALNEGVLALLHLSPP